jgi:two-component system, NtrC family, nitrogen regulation response regulator GlnG
MSAIPGKQLSVLVVDDEAGIRDLVQQWLQRAGHLVSCVTGASQAARILGKQRFDLVITDILMPDGDGFELIAMCRKSQPTASILAMSGGGKYLQSADCLKVARGLGAHATIMKPFDSGRLQAAMDDALTRKPTA